MRIKRFHIYSYLDKILCLKEGTKGNYKEKQVVFKEKIYHMVGLSASKKRIYI